MPDLIAKWRKGLPLLAGPAVAVGLLLALIIGWSMPTPTSRIVSYLALVGLTAGLLTASLVVAVGHRFRWGRLRLLLSPLLLTLAAASWLVLVESLVGKLAVVLAAGLVVGSYQSHLLRPAKKAGESLDELDEEERAAGEGAAKDAAPGEAGDSGVTGEAQESAGHRSSESARPRTIGENGEALASHESDFVAKRPGLPQAAFITDILAVFFLTAFSFGLDSFYNLPLPLMAAVHGLLWGLIAHENLWRFGISASGRRLLVGAFAVVGAESHIGLAFLPIAYLAESMIAVILLAFGLHLTRQIEMGTISSRQFRNESLASLGLIALLLITAKWI